MNCKEIVELFKLKPYYLRMSNKNIAKRLHTIPELILQARKLYRASSTKKFPKILILDIETAPLKAFIFNLWNQNITIDKITNDWFCLCWSAKWLFDSHTYSYKLTSTEVKQENDKRILTILRTYLNEADIVVTHNGEKFDLPRINTRFLLLNIPLPTPYQSIDTYKVVKNQFAFSSNKLDFLATKFNLPNKIETTFDLWAKCVEGDRDALIQMEEYNRYDVELLENVYLRLRPYIKNHPNLGLYLELTSLVCPNCGSTNLHLESTYYTNTNKYNLFRCECGALARSRQTILEKEVRNNLLNSNVR